MRQWQAFAQFECLGALAYPMLLIAVSALLVPSILVFIVPKIEPLFESLRADDKVPLATKVLLQLSACLASTVCCRSVCWLGESC